MKTRLLPLLIAALAVLAAVTPRSAWARHGHDYARPTGRVLVYNQSGGTVTVTLPGQPARQLSPWTSAELYAAAGETAIRATYWQFGAERTLQSDRLYVVPGRTAVWNLAAEDTARLLVTNDAPYDAQLLVDGRPDATFRPGEARVVTTHIGRVTVEMTAHGRALDRETLDLRAFEEPRWTASVPRVGDLVVENPLPVPVTLEAEKGALRTLPAYGRTTYTALPGGAFRVTARRVTGEYIDGESNDIRPGSVTTWRIDPPRTGFVSLDSDHWLGVEVRVDGRRMVDLAPNGVHRLETKVGWHEVEVRDEQGRIVLSRWIEVGPYDVSRVSFGVGRHVPANEGRSDRGRGERDHDHDDHRGHDHRDGVADAGDNCDMH